MNTEPSKREKLIELTERLTLAQTHTRRRKLWLKRRQLEARMPVRLLTNEQRDNLLLKRLGKAERRIKLLCWLFVLSVMWSACFAILAVPGIIAGGRETIALIRSKPFELPEQLPDLPDPIATPIASIIDRIVPPTQPQKNPTKPVVKEEEVPIYEGPPEKELPEGYLIKPVWEVILKGTKLEKGTPEEALRLYWVQRSECTKANVYECVSDEGALGWFQAMTDTWKLYAELGWDPFNLEDATRFAYRKQTADKLLETSTKQDYMERFTGYDGGFEGSFGKQAWNQGRPGNPGHDGWDQAEWVWENYQATLHLIKQNHPEPEPSPPAEPKKMLICSPVPPGTNVAYSFGIMMWYGIHTGQDFNSQDEFGRYKTIESFAITSGSITTSFDPTVNYIVELRPDGLDNVVVKYWHMNGESIQNLPEHVDCGQSVGIADGGGTVSKGKHLHLQIEVDGMPVNPMEWMEQYGGMPEKNEPGEPEEPNEPGPVPPDPEDPGGKEEPEAPPDYVPNDYKLVAKDTGISLYKRDLVYAQVINLQEGAHIDIRVDLSKKGKPELHDPSTRGQAFCSTTGSFHKVGFTDISYSVKTLSWETSGWDNRNDRELRLLSLWDDHATITKYELGKPILSPQGLVGEHPLGKREPRRSTGRNYVGVDDRDSDGVIETIIILIMTNGFTEKQAMEEMSSWGISDSNMVMFDGGTSTRIVCRGNEYSKFFTSVVVSLTSYSGR